MSIKHLFFILAACQTLSLQAAPNGKPEITYLYQGWTPQERAEYYWTSQGSALLSYDIYINLAVTGSNELFNSPQNANVVGLLMDKPNAITNPDNLPIGVSKEVIAQGQFAGTYAGLTCAACHTGQIQYKGKQIRIDGGVPNRFDINSWIRSLSSSLDETLKDPARFQQMIARMQAKDRNIDVPSVKRRLESDSNHVRDLVQYEFLAPFNPGPGRMDALGSIHNVSQAITPRLPSNLSPTAAPVKPPFLWYAPQSAWVQWSGVADNPLRRNFTETLGVFARYNLTSPSIEKGLFETTSNIKNIVKIEDILKSLTPPVWPESSLGKIDQAKAAKGKQLYAENCIECHSTYPFRWSSPRKEGKRFIENALVPQTIVGTDEEQFNGITFDGKRTTMTGQLAPIFGGQTMVTRTQFATEVQAIMLNKALKAAGPFTPQETMDMNGYTNPPGDPREVGPTRSYKAAMREGTWAVAPYMHNGSIPNLYEVLSAAKDRSSTFRLSRDFDPIKVGLSGKGKDSDFLFDTKLIGNSNRGHSFEDGSGEGIIGRKLKEDEKYALIEYLKTLPNTPGQVLKYGEPPQNGTIAREDKTWFNYKHPYAPASY